MSAKQVSSCTPINDSNIPLPKRLHTGSKKPKGFTRVTEMQKYIDTIIKASNECDSNDPLAPDKDKYRQEKKFGKSSPYKEFNSKIKIEKVKLDVDLKRHKNSNKTDTSVPDAVSSGDTTSSVLISGFEDPRNWKFNKLQNSSFTLKVEKFLRELYPNPYHLDNLNEFCDSKSDQKDTAGEGMLSEDVSSEIITDNQENTGSNESVTAVVDECSSSMEYDIKNSLPVTSSEQLTEPTRKENSKTFESLNTPEVNLELVKRPIRSRVKNHPSNGSSSLEAITSAADRLQRFIKKTNLKMSRKKNAKEIVKEVKTKPLDDEKLPDCGNGKLKALSMTDSDESDASKKVKEDKIKNSESDDFLNTLDSKIYKQELRQIHEIVDKADENFLLISDKNQSRVFEVSENAVNPISSVEFSDGLEQDFQYDTKESENEQLENYCEVDAPNLIKPAIDLGGLSFASIQFNPLKADNSNFKTAHSDHEPSPLNFSKFDLALSKSLQFIEEKTEKEVKNRYSDTSQKIDEVLGFLYDCLMKFSTPEETEGECSSSVVRRIFSTHQIVQPSTSKLAYETENSFCKMSQRSYSEFLDESTRKRFRTRSRKSEFVLQPENKECEIQSTDANLEDQPALYANPEVNNETHIPTVETQNELGGYSEMIQDDSISTESLRLPKSVFPLSAKPNKSKTEARNLREVLENEERLFAQEFSPKERTECVKPKELVTCKAADEYRITETSNTYSITSSFKCPSSNFVICVNSLPRNLKTFTAVTPVIAIPQCPPLSIINIKEHRDIRPVTCNSGYSRQFCPPCETGHQVLTCTYGLKEGSLYAMNKLTVEYIATPICEKIVSNTSEFERENSLKNSECFVRVSTKPTKESAKINKITRSSLTIPNKSATMSPPCGINSESEDEKKVEALMQAIEDAEGKIRFLQNMKELPLNNGPGSSGHNWTGNAMETAKNETSESESENGLDKKKVHDLLIRTYKLQLKLQECLEKISTLHPILPKGIKGDAGVDFNIIANSKANSTNFSNMESKEKQNDSLPLVHWYPVAQQKPKSAEAAVVHNSTSHNPPAEEEIKGDPKESNQHPPAKTERELQTYDDDSSSVCSFKSSNDFSGESDNWKVKKETKIPEDSPKKNFYDKIYKEIELIRQNFEMKLPKNINRDLNFQNAEEENQNTLVQFDTQSPAKTLKTVFKGRESSTELTIGLKDIPMTQVKNISVEKKKLSPNHTRIAICISKEKLIRVGNIKSETFHNKLPAYHCKPVSNSLERIHSGVEEVEDVTSKTSQSANESEEEEEEDYKSAGSTFEDSDTEGDRDKSAAKEQKAVKKIPKHRFDFYRKMKTNFEEKEVKPKTVSASVCTYKELEPLNQAMTEMQIRMRSIKRDSLIKGNDYYERALKLAKMSAGYCQSCGNRAVIPNDTFGYYKTLIPRRYGSRSFRHYKTSMSPEPSFYSYRSSNADVGEHFCDLDIKHSSYLLNRTTHSNRAVLRGSVHDMPALIERM